MRPAVFFDRDGTLIEHVPYLSDPDAVRLIPGAASALRRLNEAGFASVVVTNQSAVGRGWMTIAQVHRVHHRMRALLADAGARLDGIYVCPEAPLGEDRTAVEHPDRKPGPGLLIRAARELGLDLCRSWIVGDMISDLLAGRHAGCRGSILVLTGCGPEALASGSVTTVARDARAAVEMILLRHASEPHVGPCRCMAHAERDVLVTTGRNP